MLAEFKSGEDAQVVAIGAFSAASHLIPPSSSGRRGLARNGVEKNHYSSARTTTEVLIGYIAVLPGVQQSSLSQGQQDRFRLLNNILTNSIHTNDPPYLPFCSFGGLISGGSANEHANYLDTAWSPATYLRVPNVQLF